MRRVQYLVSILLQQIKIVRSEKRIRRSQYSFRAHHSSDKALAIFRRMLDATHNNNDAQLHVDFYDWAKAFDRINPQSLLIALKRFGLPTTYLEMIGEIYEKRKFCIRSDHHISSERDQSSGIAQGCPLSPYLFIIMMTIMFQDIDSAMQNFDGEDNTPDYIATRDILYADDTILLGASRDQMQYYLDTVVRCENLGVHE